MNYLDLPSTPGLLTITDSNTGKFYLMNVVNLKRTAGKVIGQLNLGKFQNKPLQDCYDLSKQVKLTYAVTNSSDEARALKHDIMREYYGKCELLNIQDYPKLAGSFKYTHSSGMMYIGSTHDITAMYNHSSFLLRTGKFKCKPLQKLYNEDPTSLSFSFNICDNKEQADIIAKRMCHDADKAGMNLKTRGRKYGYSGPGVYWLKFESGMYYIGSSRNVNHRLAVHDHKLRTSTHPNPVMTTHYNKGYTAYDVIVEPCDTLEEARELEQALLDKCTFDDQCMNLAKEVGSSASYIWSNPEHRKTLINGIRSHKSKPEVRKAYGEKMKKYWSDPDAKAARMGGGNPFAKPIKMFGVLYGSVMDAVRTKILPDSVIRKRLKDPNDLEIVYCVD